MQINTNSNFTLAHLREWLSSQQRRLRAGDSCVTLSVIADRAAISRQTLYALLRNERSEFGEAAQIRLSRVIQQILVDPAYRQTRLLKVDLSGGTPRLLLDGQR
jgi:hypothetical protein